MLFEWAKAGEDVGADLQRSLDELQQEVETAESKKMLGGEHDRSNAIVTIHPGAGGTESQDWAEMLLRMYLKWSERKGFKRELIDYQPGEEAGIKSATVLFIGEYAFGLMSAEAAFTAWCVSRRSIRRAPAHVLRVGVRLARAARGRRRRHRGQGPAHRHLPVERRRRPARQRHRLRGPHHAPPDRHRRVVSERALAAQEPREAMKVLKARLFDLKMKEQQAKLEQIGGEKRDIAFGSQIRSYVLQPYQMVKDHRTKLQVGDVERVLDGDIDPFIKTYLMKKASGTLDASAAPDED